MSMPPADKRLTEREYVHLYNRAGFGLRPGELPRSSRIPSRFEAVDELLDIGVVEDVPSTIGRADQWLNVSYALRSDWIKRMSRPGRQALLERMTLFWNNHFSCLPMRENLAITQLNLLRREALGNFRRLMGGMATDIAMMRYLDASYISKAAPNENFAREILELFTVGLKGYTENDVKGLAKSLTGWGLDHEERFYLHQSQIDKSSKTIFETTEAYDGLEAIELVSSRRDTARHLTTKLWFYLTNRYPIDSLVERLADVFVAGDFEISPWLRAIFTSDEFYDPSIIGLKVKSPIDLLVMWTRHAGADLPSGNDLWINFTRFNGQFLYAPLSVAGWPGGRAWLNSSTIAHRMALPTVSAGAKFEQLGHIDAFEGLAGYATEAVKRIKGTKDLPRRVLNHDAGPRDAVTLASHSSYQYA